MNEIVRKKKREKENFPGICNVSWRRGKNYMRTDGSLTERKT